MSGEYEALMTLLSPSPLILLDNSASKILSYA